MTDQEAKAWVAERFGAHAVDRIRSFIDAVIDESSRQNLVSQSTLPTIWTRHVVDSAQLLALAEPGSAWADIGTGAGFPGMIVALLTDSPVILIEPRRKRADFLASFAQANALPHVRVVAGRAETTSAVATRTISARAVASISDIFAMTRHLADQRTRYLLPRGRSIGDELNSAKADWHGMFHVDPSITDPDSGILVASKVRRR